MKAMQYHDSFFTPASILLPRNIDDTYPAEALPDSSVPMAKLIDTCPNCGAHLWGSYKHKLRKVVNVMCWNLNCLWSEGNGNS